MQKECVKEDVYDKKEEMKYCCYVRKDVPWEEKQHQTQTEDKQLISRHSDKHRRWYAEGTETAVWKHQKPLFIWRCIKNAWYPYNVYHKVPGFPIVQ